MRASLLIASLACATFFSAAFFSEDVLAQPAQPPVAQPTDPAQQPPIAGQGGAAAQGGASTGGQTIIVVQGSGSGAAAAPKKPEGPPEDGVRFRGGVGLAGGVFALPSFKLNLGAIGPTGHVGVQINDLVGVYFVPGFDVIFGHLGGVDVHLAAVVDFTIADRFSVGIGPDVGDFAAIGFSSSCGPTGSGVPCGVSAIGGAGFGARIHLAAYPVVGRSDTGPRRKAFAIGLDTRILAENDAGETVGANGIVQSVGYGVAIHAMLTIGYEAL